MLYMQHTDCAEIRAAILEGDIDKALKYTSAYYGNVLQDCPHIAFKLRCRKFLEMMRRCNELSTTSKRGANGLADESAVSDQEMELDEQHDGNWDDGMDTEEPEAGKFNELLTEAVQYGQQLRMDYPGDEGGGDKKMLDDIFSLVAYPDPKRSVHGHYLDPSGRTAVAEELNSAILGEPIMQLMQRRVLTAQCPLASRRPRHWSGYTSKQKCWSTRSAKRAAPGRSSMCGMISFWSNDGLCQVSGCQVFLVHVIRIITPLQ